MFTYLVKMRNKKGFTLVELIVVVAIIGVMTAVAVPSLFNSNRRGEANRHNAQAQAFYYAVHQVLTNVMQDDNSESEFRLDLGGTTAMRISGGNPIVNRDAGNFFFLYLVINEGGKIAESDLFFCTPAQYNTNTATAAAIAANRIASMNYTTTPRPARYSCATACTGTCNNCKLGFRRPLSLNNRALDRLVDEIENYSDLSNQVGFYYVMFDTNFRVVMSYFSQFATRAIARGTAGGFTFTDDNRIGPGGVAGFGAHPRQYGFAGTIGNDVDRGGAPAPHHQRGGPANNQAQQWFGLAGGTRGIIPGL